MIFAGDILKAIKDIGMVKEGMMFTVDSVMPDGLIVIKNLYGTGCISMDEIGVIVEKVDAPVREWSKWVWVHNQFGEYAYRHNGKNVQVELWNGFRGKAACHPDDVFDLDSGIALAFSRAVCKFEKTVREEFKRKHEEMFTA